MCWLLPFTWDHNVFGAIHARLERGPSPTAPALLLLLLSPQQQCGKLRAWAGGAAVGAEGERGSTALQPGCLEGAASVGAWVICTEGMSSAAQF